MPAAQLTSARTFMCARCHAQALVCPHCDRGQRYCSQRCRDQARRIGQREAGRRYQGTRAGRFAHARRQQRYRQRQRQKEVTHQGSQGVGWGDVLAPELSVVQDATCKVVPAWHCHWCGRVVASQVRRGFLRHGALHDPLTHWFGGTTRGQSP